MRYRYRTIQGAPGRWRCATTGRRLPSESFQILQDDRILAILPDTCGGMEIGRNRAAWMVRLLNSGRATADRVPPDAGSWRTADLYRHMMTR